MTFVVDASTTLSWIFEDEHSLFAERVLDRLQTDNAVVPPIWSVEVANGLAVGERRGRISAARVTRAAEDLLGLPIETLEIPEDQSLRNVLDLSRIYGLTSYDASYLYLAMREGLSIATQDSDILKAAAKIGVELVS